MILKHRPDGEQKIVRRIRPNPEGGRPRVVSIRRHIKRSISTAKLRYHTQTIADRREMLVAMK